MGKGLGYFTGYPKHVAFILSNELCERFSYYGLKAILVIYMTRALDIPDNSATAIYHSFNCVCYFTPILGAMLADGLLGKFRTILYLSILYSFGCAVLSVSAIPFGGNYVMWATFVGLVIIAFGTGGIKPCVSSFGGDQFSSTQQRQKDSFFSLFYMSINTGSLLSTIITPLIRSNLVCFDDSCYSLAFGIPAILMVVATVMFAIGWRWYVKVPAGDSILQRMFGCVGTALAGKCGRSKDGEEPREHWLDYADHKYNKSFISDVKDVLRVCWLFLPLPVFWALFDQQGSTWTLQATQMNGDMGGFVMEPDMMQVLNPLLVVILVPILESAIYPILDKLRIPNRPLQRMGWGMIFAAVAFLLAGVIQILIDQGAPASIGVNEVKINFVNAASCPIDIKSTTFPHINTLPPLQNTEYYYVDFEQSKTFDFVSNCSGISTSFSQSFTFEQSKAYQIFLSANSPAGFLAHKANLALNKLPDDISHKITCAAISTLIYNTLSESVSVSLKISKENDPHLLNNITSLNVSAYQYLIYGSFRATVSFDGFMTSHDVTSPDVDSRNGAVYTLLLASNDNGATYFLKQLTDIPTWTMNMFVQIPQYVIMSLGECLFSVSGLAFAYSQASPSMKSILSAVWLLTVAFGNLIVVIISEAAGDINQKLVFFLYAGLLLVTTAVFVVMCLFYDYATPRTASEIEVGTNSEGFVVSEDALKAKMERVMGNPVENSSEDSHSSTTEEQQSNVTGSRVSLKKFGSGKVAPLNVAE